MKLLLLALFIVLTTNMVGQAPTEKQLVADETWVIASGKTSFRIITTNDSITYYMITQLSANGYDKYTSIKKKDRNGYYWERSFYFPNDMWNNVVVFIKGLK